jgi:hypothetical protein
MNLNKTGQGALEYLLLLGGAILVGVIVIMLLISTSSPSNKVANENITSAESNLNSVAVAPIIYSVGCDVSGAVNDIDIEYNGGLLTATLNGAPANISNHPTQPGHAKINIVDLCLNTGQKTVILTSTNATTNSSASATYTFLDNQPS